MNDKIFVSLTTDPTANILGEIDSNDAIVNAEILSKINAIINEAAIRKFASHFCAYKNYNLNPESFDLFVSFLSEYLILNPLLFQILTKFKTTYNKKIIFNTFISIKDIEYYYSSILKSGWSKKLINLTLCERPTIGKGEIFLTFISSMKNSQTHGDLYDEKLGHIEVKGPLGRLTNDKPTYNSKDAIHKLKVLFDKLNLHLDFDGKSIGNTFFQELLEISYYYKSNLSSKGSRTKYNEYLNAIILALMHYDVHIDNIEAIISFIKPIINSKNINHMKNFALTLHFYGYKTVEQFDHIIFFNKDYTKFKIFTTTSSIIELYSLVSNHLLNMGGWGIGSNEGSYSTLLKE